MKKFVIGECPICSHDLHVTKLKCGNCETEIAGAFQLSKFNYLSKENLYFIELFIKNKGNIKQLEKELNVSYPTVKKMLEEAIVNLGYTVTEDEDEAKRNDILQKIAEGKIKPDEALKLLK
ncbi:MAG: DUF2089 domain-containing protein [Acholeplasmatales bacterium]|nr:MAG: DUF2089 domain-containing protein [Acholeplasmatales bacterium]